MKVFASYNLKGGVGKTASAVVLSYLSVLDGARTLLWDLDPQGAASFYFRLETKIRGGGRKLLAKKKKLHRHIRGSDFDGLDVLPSDFSYRHMDIDLEAGKHSRNRLARLLEPVVDDYDHVFLDCPPSLSLVTENVFIAADVLLVPTLPTPLSLRALQQLHRHLQGSDDETLEVLPFLCMTDQRKKLHRTLYEHSSDYGFDFLQTRIPYSTVIEQMGIHRLPLHAFASSSPAAEAYSNLWREILERINAVERT